MIFSRWFFRGKFSGEIFRGRFQILSTWPLKNTQFDVTNRTDICRFFTCNYPRRISSFNNVKLSPEFRVQTLTKLKGFFSSRGLRFGLGFCNFLITGRPSYLLVCFRSTLWLSTFIIRPSRPLSKDFQWQDELVKFSTKDFQTVIFSRKFSVGNFQ